MTGLGQQPHGLRYRTCASMKSWPRNLSRSRRLGALEQLLEQAKSKSPLARGLHPVAIVPDGPDDGPGQLADRWPNSTA